MKIGRIICSILLVALCAGGWFIQLSDRARAGNAYTQEVSAARDYEERGLHQLAVRGYETALAIRESASVREELVQAAAKGYEAGALERSVYQAQLEAACGLYPKNEKYWERLLGLLCGSGDYRQAYETLTQLDRAGAESEALEGYRLQVLYTYTVKPRVYYDHVSAPNGYTTVFDGDHWGVRSPDGEEAVGCEYLYISPYGSDRVALYCTETKNVIMDASGVVLAYVEGEIAQARAYGDGLLPILRKDGWRYFSVKEGKDVLGPYEDASAFQNGYAMVAQKGTWSRINLSGEDAGGPSFRDVKLYENGAYTQGGRMVAAEGEKYGLYTEAGERVGEILAADMDVSLGGYIAYQDGGGRWGYLDGDGAVVLEPEYRGARSFSAGLAAVFDGTAWSFIDSQGRTVIEGPYLDAGTFSSGGACFVSEIEGEEYLIVRRFP